MKHLAIASIFLSASATAFAAPAQMTEVEMSYVIAGDAGTPGYGNITAGQADCFSGTNFCGSLAEDKSGKPLDSDIGEGRERADEVNGKDRTTWAENLGRSY